MEISKSSIFLYRVVKEQKSQRGERTKMGVTERERAKFKDQEIPRHSTWPTATLKQIKLIKSQKRPS